MGDLRQFEFSINIRPPSGLANMNRQCKENVNFKSFEEGMLLTGTLNFLFYGLSLSGGGGKGESLLKVDLKIDPSSQSYETQRKKKLSNNIPMFFLLRNSGKITALQGEKFVFKFQAKISR